MRKLSRLFPWLKPTGTAQIVPRELRSRFHHLYGDIAWYGLTAGTTLAFLSVYAARIGATALEIGLLTAGPALVNLVFTLPVGRYLQSRPIGRSVFWSAVVFRFLFLIYALLPMLLAQQFQIQVLIWATLIMTIPGTALAIGFNALFAAAVPQEWRGYVVGRRNAVLSIVFVLISLLSGYVLRQTSLEIGYTIVFGVGLIGAVMSTFHLSFLRDVMDMPGDEPRVIREVIGDFARPGYERGGQGVGQRISIALRAFTRGDQLMQFGVLRGGYGVVILALFSFHLAQFMPAPLFPLRWVGQLKFDDGQIAIGTAFFHSSVLIGSLFFDRFTRRFGNHLVTVAGAGLLSLYPLLTAIMPDLLFYIVTSVVGGFGWALVGGALGNYLLEKVPTHDRPAYLAWYNMALNAAILLGALLGPLLAGWLNIQLALALIFVFRLSSALFIYLAERYVRQHVTPTP